MEFNLIAKPILDLHDFNLPFIVNLVAALLSMKIIVFQLFKKISHYFLCSIMGVSLFLLIID
jgi:uncharacterized membrane protein